MALSRRSLLKRLGAAGSGAIVPLPASAEAPPAVPAPAQAPAAAGRAAPVAPRAEALESLTAAQAEILEAVTARIIPTDANGPGAREARAAHYIDRALAGPLSAARAAYVSGLDALDAYARGTKGAPFIRLAPADQDAVLEEVQKNAVPGFAPSGQAFFNLVRAHTIEGTFGDPYYGGNAGFVGWDLIGYPGVRIAATAAEQQMGVKIAANHRSAYDFPMFNRNGGGDAH